MECAYAGLLIRKERCDRPSCCVTHTCEDVRAQWLFNYFINNPSLRGATSTPRASSASSSSSSLHSRVSRAFTTARVRNSEFTVRPGKDCISTSGEQWLGRPTPIPAGPSRRPALWHRRAIAHSELLHRAPSCLPTVQRHRTYFIAITDSVGEPTPTHIHMCTFVCIYTHTCFVSISNLLRNFFFASTR